MKLKQSIASLLFTSSVSVLSAQISGVNIFDDTIAFFNNAAPVTTGVFDARWGTFSGDTFTPYYGSVSTPSNDGYIGDPFGALELFSSLTASDNSVAVTGTQMFLVVTLNSYQAEYFSTFDEVVLTDPSWIVPPLALVGNPVDYFLTPATTAVKGGFAFNPSGSVITISSTVIPEPSSVAALAGISVLGMVMSRRRRSV